MICNGVPSRTSYAVLTHSTDLQPSSIYGRVAELHGAEPLTVAITTMIPNWEEPFATALAYIDGTLECWIQARVYNRVHLGKDYVWS